MLIDRKLLQGVVFTDLLIVQRTADLEIYFFPLVFNLMGEREGHIEDRVAGWTEIMCKLLNQKFTLK